MRNLKHFFLFLLMFLAGFQDCFPQFSISDNKRFLLKAGKPFFWLGDTAWELFHRLNREEANQYFKRRSEQGFTVVQAVVLAEMDGLHVPNAYGEKPLVNDDPTKPNEKYFQHVDYIVDKANQYNINIGMLPTWGDKINKDRWGKGPEIFNEQNAAVYAGWLANRYKNKTNIVWILGGDRNPRNESDIAIWRAMGKAIKKATSDKAVISYHPQPNDHGSAEWFHKEEWLDFNMFQTGHCRNEAVYEKIQAVYNMDPVKPVMDAEPIYEDHPVCFNAKDLGTSSAYDVRRAAYLDVFAGAFGHTYGCHDIWQMYSAKTEPVNGPHLYWNEALDLPGANQMIYLKRLVESHSYTDRVPDQSLILENNYAASERIQATRGSSYAFIYSSAGKPFTVDASKIKGTNLAAHWLSPRDGKTSNAGQLSKLSKHKFQPPTSGYGQDWVLVIESDGKNEIQSNTSFGEGTAEYGKMLSDLENDMLNYQESWKDTLGGKVRNVFVPWIRDHVHVSKAMKYIHPDMTSFLEFFLENQTDEGLYFDYYMSHKEATENNRKNIFNHRYWKILPEDDSIEMHRLPVEADLEYLLVEGVYAAWQSTGDIDFVKKWLPALVKGVHYSMSDPLRWSKRYQLVKRGYTLDTWDFMQLPYDRDEFKRRGGDIQKGIFDIDENTPMGIMHGDNSGLYAACNQLSAMYAALGNDSESRNWKLKADGVQNRANKLLWNGKYYAHFVEDDPMPPYLKMDQQNTLSLSNPYDINRGLPTSEMAQSIIKTYAALKESNKANSFAEWYGVYPAVQPHFADYKPGSYMNGGVNTIVAGELAKAAFQHGYETYGVDILKRIMDLMKRFNGDLPVSYTPQGKVDEGIPDNWGQAAVYSAMIEGLAGVFDKGAQFDHVEISPRWMAAGRDTAEVKIAYGPTGKFVQYRYVHERANKKIRLDIQSPAKNNALRILLPGSSQKASAKINGQKINGKTEKINSSTYFVVQSNETGNINIEVDYK